MLAADDLTSVRVELDDGTTACEYVHNGVSLWIRDDALTVIKLTTLLTGKPDSEEENDTRGIEAIQLMFADPEEALMSCIDLEEFGELITDVAFEIYGIDLIGDKETDVPLWDPVQDAPLIRVSLRLAYGIDWDEEREKLSWSEFVYLVGALPTSTPLGLMIYYRNENNRPEKTKHNKEQIAEFDRLHNLFKLDSTTDPGSHDRSVEQAQQAMDDFALALGSLKK